MTGTQGKMPAPGPVGRNLIANVDRLRAERGWTGLSGGYRSSSKSCSARRGSRY